MDVSDFGGDGAAYYEYSWHVPRDGYLLDKNGKSVAVKKEDIILDDLNGIQINYSYHVDFASNSGFWFITTMPDIENHTGN